MGPQQHDAGSFLAAFCGCDAEMQVRRIEEIVHREICAHFAGRLKLVGFCAQSAISHNELWECTPGLPAKDVLSYSKDRHRHWLQQAPGQFRFWNRGEIVAAFDVIKTMKPIQWEHGVDKHWFPACICSACQVGEAAAIEGESQQEPELSLHEQAPAKPNAAPPGQKSVGLNKSVLNPKNRLQNVSQALPQKIPRFPASAGISRPFALVPALKVAPENHVLVPAGTEGTVRAPVMTEKVCLPLVPQMQGTFTKEVPNQPEMSPHIGAEIRSALMNPARPQVSRPNSFRHPGKVYDRGLFVTEFTEGHKQLGEDDDLASGDKTFFVEPNHHDELKGRQASAKFPCTARAMRKRDWQDEADSK